jgi:hypothetical protein
MVNHMPGARKVALAPLLAVFLTAPGNAHAWDVPEGSDRGVLIVIDDLVALQGEWQLTLPAGFEFTMTVEPHSEPHHYLLRGDKASNLQGLYKLEGERLEMVTPKVPRIDGLVWEFSASGGLVLVEQPEGSRPGADYRGATLKRARE